MEKPRYDVFLSHATLDKPVVEELARRLKKAGFEPWLDKWNLIPGEPWQEAIEQALEDCAACAVCIGPSGTGPWQNEEMRAAIDRRVSDRSRTFRVIPVLLPQSERGEPSRLPAFLRTATWVEFRETLDDENALHRLASGIRGLPPGPDPGEAVAEGAQPYRGLQVFDVGDSLFFFGREALTEWLLDKLRTDRTGNRFLAIVGPSGSGKSSLARAGLFAALKQGKIPGSDVWPVAICKPGAQPLESLAVALAGAARLGDSPSAVLNLIRDLGADPRLLHLTTRLALHDTPADRRLVVLVDQFEEVFTLCPDEAQRQAIIANLLHAATAADGQTVVVLTLRADFYGRCAAYPDLATAVSDRQSLVGPMTRDELQSAIERPAYLAGCELEGGLTDLLLNEVESQPNSLPLLEHALLQIWQRREGGRRLTIAAYHEIGGVAGALEKHAEEVYSGFTNEEKEACRQISLRLVQVDEQGRATKRRLGLEELPGEGVVSRLTNARLLTTDQEKQPTVELAHEALLANWKRLKQWIGEDRDALRTRRRLDEAVAEWIGRDRDSSFLLEGGRLAQAEEWAAEHSGELGADAREFLKVSVDGRDRERQREIAQVRRQKRWTLISFTAAMLALIAAIYTGYLWQVADQRQKIDSAGHLAEKAKLPFQQSPTLALLLSIKAVRLSIKGNQPHLPSSEETLRELLTSFRGLPLPTGRIRAASVSADHHWLAVAGADGSVSLWNLSKDGLARILSLPGNSAGAAAEEVAAAPGGKWLLASFQNGSRLIGAGAKQEPGSSFDLEEEDWLIDSDPFSPDGRWLLTRHGNRTWVLRELTDPSRRIATLSIEPTALGFSPNGQWLATAVESGTIQIWNLRQQPLAKPQFEITGSKKPEALAFSADSRWLVVAARAASSSTVQAWRMDPAPGQGSPISLKDCAWSSSPAPSNVDPLLVSRFRDLARCLPAPAVFGGNTAFTAAMHPDGTGLFSVGSADGTLALVNGPSVWTKKFQEGPIWLLAFQGRWLISEGGSDSPRLLEILPGPDIAMLEPRSLPVVPYPLAVSPQGWQLSVNPETPHAYLWGPRGPRPIEAAENASAPWIFSSDGLWLAAAGADGRPLVWRIGKDGTPSLPLSISGGYHHSAAVSALAISPDGRWLASGDEDGNSRLWDLQHPEAEPHSLTNSEGGVTALAFRSDSHSVAQAAGSGPVRLRGLNNGPAAADSPEPPEGHLDRRDRGIGTPITALAFLPDGRLALGGSGERVHLWKPNGHDAFVDGKIAGIKALVVNPQGDRLASVSLRGNVQIWARQGGDFIQEPVRLPGHFKMLSFTSDGNGLWTLDENGILHRWELRTNALLNIACKAAGRNLTEREWKQYVDEPYREREPCPELPKASD